VKRQASAACQVQASIVQNDLRITVVTKMQRASISAWQPTLPELSVID
jgi:hypothetical protein